MAWTVVPIDGTLVGSPAQVPEVNNEDVVFIVWVPSSGPAWQGQIRISTGMPPGSNQVLAVAVAASLNTSMPNGPINLS